MWQLTLGSQKRKNPQPIPLIQIKTMPSLLEISINPPANNQLTRRHTETYKIWNTIFRKMYRFPNFSYVRKAINLANYFQVFFIIT